MDPLATAQPDSQGFITTVSERVQLHYELYTPPGEKRTKSPLLMVMGAFAAKAHFASTARHIADAFGHEVALYDHRGVGRSTNVGAALEAQTAASLAADALSVADSLWGPTAALHVYGASMGGMVAQELALLLIPRGRLLSLALAITCRGMQPAYGLLGPILTPRVIHAFLALWFADSRAGIVARLMRLLLTPSLLSMRHPSGQTYKEVYARAWLERFDDLWTFSDPRRGACHAHVVLHHHLSDAQLAAIRDCGVPLLAQVATEDRLIPAAMQLELADALKARTVTFPTGHLGLLPWKERFHSMLQEQLAMGEAVKAFDAADRARSSSGGGSFASIASQDLSAAMAAAAAAAAAGAPQLSAFGRRGRSSGGSGVPKPSAASRASSAPFGDGAAAAAVSDLIVDLQDAPAPSSTDAGKAAAAASAEREADGAPGANSHAGAALIA